MDDNNTPSVKPNLVTQESDETSLSKSHTTKTSTKPEVDTETVELQQINNTRKRPHPQSP